MYWEELVWFGQPRGTVYFFRSVRIMYIVTLQPAKFFYRKYILHIYGDSVLYMEGRSLAFSSWSLPYGYLFTYIKFVMVSFRTERLTGLEETSSMQYWVPLEMTRFSERLLVKRSGGMAPHDPLCKWWNVPGLPRGNGESLFTVFVIHLIVPLAN